MRKQDANNRLKTVDLTSWQNDLDQNMVTTKDISPKQKAVETFFWKTSGVNPKNFSGPRVSIEGDVMINLKCRIREAFDHI